MRKDIKKKKKLEKLGEAGEARKEKKRGINSKTREIKLFKIVIYTILNNYVFMISSKRTSDTFFWEEVPNR